MCTLELRVCVPQSFVVHTHPHLNRVEVCVRVYLHLRLHGNILEVFTGLVQQLVRVGAEGRGKKDSHCG